MPLKKAVQISELAVGGATSDGPKSGGAVRNTSAGKRSAGRKDKRYSPYGGKKAAAAVPPGPATLLSQMDLGAGGGPISSRTRGRVGGFKQMNVRPNGAVAALLGGGSSGSGGAAAGPSSSAAAVVTKLQANEEKWRTKLQSDASWWDSAAIAFSQAAHTADVHMSAATRATNTSDRSLRTLVRGRNHGRADRSEAEDWKASQIDEFLGPSFSSNGGKKKAKSPVRQKVDPPSPGHFERLYGPRRASLPPLQIEKRTTLASVAKVAQERERRNSQAREAVFGGSR